MENYNILWCSESKNSSESMPVGGHNIGCNVWTENNEILIYFQQSGCFDENGSMLKGGRIRLNFNINPFELSFKQELILNDGYINIQGENELGKFNANIWVNVFSPIVNLDISSDYEIQMTCQYENWRFEDKYISDTNSTEMFQCKEVWMYPDKPVIFHKDTFEVSNNTLTFYHRNLNNDLSFDKEFHAQGLDSVKNGLYNPQTNRTIGGIIKFQDMNFQGEIYGKYIDTPFKAFIYKTEKPVKNQSIKIYLNIDQSNTLDNWEEELKEIISNEDSDSFNKNIKWWNNYFEKSYVNIHSSKDHIMWQIGRNYQLFRYMLGCNYFGKWPSKFNGGLFTFDPIFVNDTCPFTPDFRFWGGATHTTQNQRLLYWPMLKSGDFEAIPQFFDFFNRLLNTEKVRTKFHFNINGAIYPEQISSYGLCSTVDHGWTNTTGLPIPQIKYLFSNQLEIALMILEYHAFTGENISKYIDFINNTLIFYNEFYPQNDENGKMIMYPANALETYHVVKNPIDGIAGLHCLLRRLLSLDSIDITNEMKDFYKKLLLRIPEIKTKFKDGHEIIAYADTTSEIHNCEIPELYTVFPYGQFGLNKPNLQLAIDTALYAPQTDDQLLHVSWHQLGIQYAKLGMLDKSLDFLKKKLCNGNHRFPAFWGPGHDWTPDHNWGGSGMIQVQEMLMQNDEDKIYLFPCWDKTTDVEFKLYAPKNTTIICNLKDGEITKLEVFPKERLKDIKICL